MEFDAASADSSCGWVGPLSDWNPVAVEKEILNVTNEIAKGVSRATDAYSAFLQAEREYKRAYASAYMRHKGPAHEKRYQAELDTEAELVARDAADVAYRFERSTNESLVAKLDAMRSVGVSVRKAYESAGRGEW